MVENKNNRFVYMFAFLTYFAIFLLSISENISISHDSIFYVLGAQNNDWFFHPHHLLYHVFNQLIIIISQAIGFDPDLSYIMAAVNSFFGALMMTYIIKIFIELFKLDKTFALAASGVIAFSYGVWYYSACVEVYIIPLFFVILAYYIFFKDEGKYYHVGLYAGLATLFHQMYVFLFIVFIIAYLFKKEKFKNILKFAVSFSIVVGVVYISVLLFDYKVKSIDEAISQLTLYAHKRPEMWSHLGISIIINDIIGISRTVFSIHYLYSFESVQRVITERFPNNSFNEEVFLVRNISAGMQIFLSVVLALLIGFFVRFIYGSVKNLITNKENALYKVWFFAFVGIFGLFFTLWSSNNPEFWISIYTISVITLIKYINKSKKELYILTSMSILLIAYNLFSTILFTKDINNDYYLEKIHSIGSVVHPNDIIIYDESYMINDYFLYTDFKNIISVDKTNTNDIYSKIDSIKSIDSRARVFLVEELFNPQKKISDKYKSFRQESVEKFSLQELSINDKVLYELIINK